MKEIMIKGGGYEARLFPEAGGALVTLRKGDVRVFAPCDSEEEARQAPTRHGLPCLFPPNRIDAGHFVFEGREYQFPMKPNKANNFSHGFLHTRPWTAVNQTGHGVTMRFDCNEQTDFYPYYPHKFRMDVEYCLSEEGLCQKVSLSNQGALNMPVGLGWHTAFCLPFVPGSDPSGVRFRASVGRRVLLSERMLPTGEVRELDHEEQQIRAAEGQSPMYRELDDHFTALPLEMNGKPFHGAILEDPAAGVRIVYEVDPAYRHWMIFNAHSSGRLICIEPQNWRINAPNLGLGEEEAGIDVLKPGETKEYVSRIRVESIPNPAPAAADVC